MFVSSLATVLVSLPELCRHVALIVTPALDEVLHRYSAILDEAINMLKSQGKHICFVISSPRGFTDSMNILMLKYEVPVLYMHDLSESEYVLADQLPVASRTGKINLGRLLRHLERVAEFREQAASSIDNVYREIESSLNNIANTLSRASDSIGRRDFSEIIRTLTEIKLSIGTVLEAASTLMPFRKDKAREIISSVLDIFDSLRVEVENIERVVLEEVVAPLRADSVDVNYLCARLLDAIDKAKSNLPDLLSKLHLNVDWNSHRVITNTLRCVIARLREVAENMR